jgi:hypothetical protein
VVTEFIERRSDSMSCVLAGKWRELHGSVPICSFVSL